MKAKDILTFAASSLVIVLTQTSCSQIGLSFHSDVMSPSGPYDGGLIGTLQKESQADLPLLENEYYGINIDSTRTPISITYASETSGLTPAAFKERQRLCRDRIATRLMELIDQYQIKFDSDFYARGAIGTAALDITGTGLAAAAAVTTPPTVSKLLAEIGTGVLASNAILQKDILEQKSLAAIIDRVAVLQQGQKQVILKGLSKSVDDYPLAAALTDLATYSSDGSLMAGLAAIDSDTAAKKSQQDNSSTGFAASQTTFTYNGKPQGPAITPTPAGATFTASGDVLATSPGSYKITVTATGTFAGNTTTIDWTIKKAVLTITSTETMTYGGTVPKLEPIYSGLQGSDTASVVTPPTLTCPATSLSPAAPYTIAVTGASATNYDINSVPGTFTVTRAPLTITAKDDTRVYTGSPYLGGNGVTYIGFVNNETSDNALAGTLTYSGNSQNAVDAGSYSILPDGLTATNYAISFVAGSLTITKKPQQTPVVTAMPSLITMGQTSDLGAIGGESTGKYDLKIESGLGTLSGTKVTPTGTGTITVSVTKEADKNYLQSNPATATITVH